MPVSAPRSTTAHLRASGGTIARPGDAHVDQGASPRERRNHAGDTAVEEALGRISARAEEPLESDAQNPTFRAHLRASGGTTPAPPGASRSAGASPRERRNPRTLVNEAEKMRRISARAEEPANRVPSRQRLAAHLRASGGTLPGAMLASQSRGASPRERRNRHKRRRISRQRGRISARAEEPITVWRSHAQQEAHLRASGGTTELSVPLAVTQGASPRERRNPLHRAVRLVGSRRISARAEEPEARLPSRYSLPAHLRASGGTASLLRGARSEQGASPRERRNLLRRLPGLAEERRISARAEEPAPRDVGRISRRAHLRASGGTSEPCCHRALLERLDKFPLHLSTNHFKTAPPDLECRA